MKKNLLISVVLILFLIMITGCAQKDLRLLKDFYPSTIDAPKEIEVVPSFPTSIQQGAVKNVLSLNLKITNNSREKIIINPSKIYLMIGTEMHATLPAESVITGGKENNISHLTLKKETLNPGETTEGVIYFPKTSVEKIKDENIFNLNLDIGEGKKIVVVFQK